MNYKVFFILLVSLFFNAFNISDDSSYLICLIIIISVGIPHGAADHRIHQSINQNTPIVHFIFQYVLIAAAFGLWWLILPVKAAILFLLLSAYHFGQEYLESHGYNKAGFIQTLIWGNGLLILPIILSLDEIYSTLYLLGIVPKWWPSMELRFILCILGALAIFIGYQSLENKTASRKKGSLLITLLSIWLSYYLLPFIVAFTLYFILIHSFNALSHQYSWLSSRIEDYGVLAFAKDLIVFSILAIAGILMALYLMYPLSSIELVIYSFAMISMLTLPHALLFDRLYKKRK